MTVVEELEAGPQRELDRTLPDWTGREGVVEARAGGISDRSV